MSTDPSSELSPVVLHSASSVGPTDHEQETSSTAPSNLPAEAARDGDDLGQLNPLLLAAIGLVLLAVLPFAGSLRGPFFWLDDSAIIDNPFVSSSDGIARFWTAADTTGRYEPLTLVSYWLQYKFSHFRPLPYRAVNLSLHAAVVVLLWILLSRLEVPGAWLAAAVFAVHPVHVQAVAWISGRDVLLSAMFYLAAMLVYLRYVGVTPVPPGSKTLFTLPSEPERLWGLSLALFACAVASHPAAVTFPLAILLVIGWKRGRVIGEEWLMLLPFFLFAVAAGTWAFYLQAMSPLKSSLVSAFGPTPIGNLIEYGIRAIPFYAAKTLAPFRLAFDYPRFAASSSALAASIVAIVLIGVALLTGRRKLGRGPIAAAALFVVVLLPMLGILDAPAIRYSFVADFREYLASAAIIALVVGWLSHWFNHHTQAMRSAGSYVGGAVVILLFFGAALISSHYAHADQVWNDTFNVNKESVLASDNYGELLRFAHQFPEARQWFEHVEHFAPGDPRAKYDLGLTDEAEAFDELHAGQTAQADRLKMHAAGEFDEAIALDENFAPASIALGDLYSTEKKEKEAIAAYRQAIMVLPLSLRARLGLAGAMRRDGQLDAALEQLTEVIDINANIPAAHTELGNVYLQKHQPSDAVKEWAKAAVLDPFNTTILVNYGGLLASSGQLQAAAKQFYTATRLNPSLKSAHLDLGLVELQLGQNQDAVMEFNKAVEIDPSDPRAKKLLNDALDAVKMHGPGKSATSQPAAAEPATTP